MSAPLSPVTFFLIGYLTTPFFVVFSQEIKELIVAFIFLLGAVYVAHSLACAPDHHGNEKRSILRGCCA
jgi:hypothetical protein